MRIRPIALLAAALLTGCLALEDADDDDTSPTPYPDGQIVVTTVCTDDTCGETGTLVVRNVSCAGGAVIALFASDAGVTLTTAGHISGQSPAPAGTYCVDGWLDLGADGVLSSGDVYATDAPLQGEILVDETLRFTLVLNTRL